ncbi:hypothetical protein [Pseudomonas sp. WS 5532]|uniref:hypothetical protein n=1 Tax=Pseudomonas sp. WS 5532 TaxID=2717495 RepID=UPI0021CCE320|nr:hypothetical protein [Pseudomonas sp. WS 5532]
MSVTLLGPLSNGGALLPLYSFQVPAGFPSPAADHMEQLISLDELFDTGTILHSYTMLTINADDHSFMRNYHKPQDEKRMVVILPRGLYGDWLKAPASDSAEFMRQYPADRLAVAT